MTRYNPPPGRPQRPPPRPSLPPVVHEDDSLIAFDKPSGLVVAPDRWDKARVTLMQLVHAQYGAAVANAHRLDADTSGVLLCAKGPEALRGVLAEWEGLGVRKRYVALVQGRPAQAAWRVDLPLGDDPRHPGRMRVDREGGKQSVTEFAVLETFAGWALLECIPHTGRTHQIRVHLDACGLPIVADRFYGRAGMVLLSAIKPGYRFKEDEPEKPLLGRLGLHAESLELTHPATGARVRIAAPEPHDFGVALKYLRRFAVDRAAATEPAP